jgi:hypothetical protein
VRDLLVFAHEVSLPRAVLEVKQMILLTSRICSYGAEAA